MVEKEKHHLASLDRLTRLVGLSPLFMIPSTPLRNVTSVTVHLIYICLLAIPCVYQFQLLYSNTPAITKIELSELVTLLEVVFLSIVVLMTRFCSVVFYYRYITIITAICDIENLMASLQMEILVKQDVRVVYAQIYFVTILFGFNVLEYLEHGYINWNYITMLPMALISLYQFLYFIIYISYCYECVNKYLLTSATTCKRGDVYKNVLEEIGNTLDANKTQNYVSPSSLKYFEEYSKWQVINCTSLESHNTYCVRVNNIAIVREIHRLLYEVCKVINEFFSVHILLWLATIITTVTMVFYYLLSSTKLSDLWLGKSEYWTPRYNKAILGVTNFLHLTAIVFLCVAASEEASSTGILVHGLLNSSPHAGLAHDLKIFSSQVLQQKVSFTAAGLFPLDFTLINGVIGAVTTYLVILIQFQLST